MFHFLFFKFVNAELFEIEIFVIKAHPFAHLVLMGPLAHLVLIGPSVPLAPTQLLPSLTPLASINTTTLGSIGSLIPLDLLIPTQLLPVTTLGSLGSVGSIASLSYHTATATLGSLSSHTATATLSFLSSHTAMAILGSNGSLGYLCSLSSHKVTATLGSVDLPPLALLAPIQLLSPLISLEFIYMGGHAFGGYKEGFLYTCMNAFGCIGPYLLET